MKSNTIFSLLIILILAFSLAMLPYIGLPYVPLKATGLRLAVYEPPQTQQLYLPMVVRE